MTSSTCRCRQAPRWCIWASRPARRTVPTEAIQDKTFAVSQRPWAPAVRALLHSQQSPNWLCQAPTTDDRLMMNKMIVGNLVHRPLRSLISIVAIALEVTLILLIVGLCVGMLNDSKARQAGIGADVIVQPPNTSFMAGVSNAPMSIKIGGVISQLQHVQTVSPVIWQLSTT